MTLLDIGTGWEHLAVCGRPITGEFANEWFKGKVKGEWAHNAPLGIAIRLDHLRTITTLFYFAAGVETARGKAYAGQLPGGLTFATSREAVLKLFGKPTMSGEPSGEPGSIMHIPFAWDKWEIADHGTIRVEYVEGNAAIRIISLEGVALPDPTSVTLQVYADYSQFYVADTANKCDTASIWDDPESSPRQIAMGAGLVAIGTKRYGTVPVRIETYPAEPVLELGGIDRINECGLTITEKLGVGNYVSSPELTEVDGIAPGTYGIRVLYLYQDQVISDTEGKDEYVVQLWPVPELLKLRHIKPKPTVKKAKAK
jgi:hypothetical protein